MTFFKVVHEFRIYIYIYIYIYTSGWIFEKVIDSYKPSVPPPPSQTFQSQALIKMAAV